MSLARMDTLGEGGQRTLAASWQRLTDGPERSFVDPRSRVQTREFGLTLSRIADDDG